MNEVLPNVLNQLMVTWEGFKTLLTLMRFHFWSSSNSFSPQLHGSLCHQILNKKNKLVENNSKFIKTTSVCCIIGPSCTRLLRENKWSAGGFCAILLHFPSDHRNYLWRGVEHIPKRYQSCCKSASHDIIIRFWISINCGHDMDTGPAMSDTCLVLLWSCNAVSALTLHTQTPAPTKLKHR